MAKYDGLAKFLSEADEDSLTLKFARIAELVEGGLPPSAYEHRPWWANRYDGKGSQSQGWQSVGWETCEVNLERSSVTFRRAVKRRSDFKDSPYVRPLTIAEAKAGLAAHLGVPRDNIDIVVRG
jgi:hypothetical protein